MKIKNVGIVGYGAMGQLLASFASNYLDSSAIKIVEKKTLPEKTPYQLSSLENLKNCDLIILAVATKNLKELANSLAKIQLNKNQLVCSISATMSYAEEVLRSELPEAGLLITHPLFGPASLKQNNNSLKNLEIALNYQLTSEENQKAIKEFLSANGLIVQEITSQKHDQIMAKNHLIPYMLSHLLKDYQFIDSSFKTKSLQELLKFLEHTSYNPEILSEIITYNPYAPKELQSFRNLLDNYTKLEANK